MIIQLTQVLPGPFWQALVFQIETRGKNKLAVDEPGSRAIQLVNKILAIGVEGLGPYKSATEIAEEALAHHGNSEFAIKRLIAIHRRWVAGTGFTTGIGGLALLPVSIPADMTTFYALCARMSGSIAVIRGYDLQSEEVRSAILISLLGAGAAGVLGGIGVEVGTKTALGMLRKLPGHMLIEINKKIGFRLVTKFGSKGAINLVKGVPVIGGGVGAGVNVLAINRIALYSNRIFIQLEPPGDSFCPAG